MWNSPRFMTAMANLLLAMAIAAILAKAAFWGARQPWFPLREVVFRNELREVRRVDLERALSAHVRGSFFSIELDAVRSSLEQLPWVRRAEVRRQWPLRLEVSVEEHKPVAFWGLGMKQLVNTHGEVFAAATRRYPAASMPVLVGPGGFTPEMLEYYRMAEDLLRPTARRPQALIVSPRLAFQMRLDDGMIVELGRPQSGFSIRQRLERFVEYYSRTVSAVPETRPDVVDMRYPNGFTLRVNASSANESKGKP